MELSVVIVNFNASGYLRQCLVSLAEALRNIDNEIFVVDNNSPDDSCSMVAGKFPDVRLICNSTNRGFSAACNQAIRESSGNYILLLNPDTVIPSDTMTKCMEFMSVHPDAGALGVKLTDADGIFLPESKRSLPSPSSAFFKSFGFSALFPGSNLFNRYYLSSVDMDETAVSEVVPGAFMLLRKTVLNITGFLDEDYFMYGEDIELSYSIIRAGFRNYYFPEAGITHLKGGCTPRNGYSDILHFYDAMRIYVNKRKAEGYFRNIHALLISGIFLRESLALANRFIRNLFRP